MSAVRPKDKSRKSRGSVSFADDSNIDITADEPTPKVNNQRRRSSGAKKISDSKNQRRKSNGAKSLDSKNQRRRSSAANSSPDPKSERIKSNGAKSLDSKNHRRQSDAAESSPDRKSQRRRSSASKAEKDESSNVDEKSGTKRRKSDATSSQKERRSSKDYAESQVEAVVSEPNGERQMSTTNDQTPVKTHMFTMDEKKIVMKPIKNHVYYIKLCFLCLQTFNLVYVGTVIYYMYHFFAENKDFQIVISGTFGLALVTCVLGIRIAKSLYGIYAVLFARSRRPLYLYLLFNYFVSVIYIIVGLIVAFPQYIRWRFEKALVRHLKQLTSHRADESPTWYLVENVQHYGHCCGYQNLIDYIKVYQENDQSEIVWQPDLLLPLTCCRNAIRGDACGTTKDDLILAGCAQFIELETMKRIILPIVVLLMVDLLSLLFIFYLMRNFKDNLVRIEIKEDENLFLDREESRLINELLAEKFIKESQQEKVKQKYRDVIKIEQNIHLRPTMEGLILIIRKAGQNIEIRVLNPGRGGAEDSDYLEGQLKSDFKDLFDVKEKDEKPNVRDNMMPFRIEQKNVLFMTGGDVLSDADAQKNLDQFGLSQKIQPWQAVRTRNAIQLINQNQDKSRSLRKKGLLKPLVRYNSVEVRLDKRTIECDLRELGHKGETNISNDVKGKIASTTGNGEAKIRIVRPETGGQVKVKKRKGKKRPKVKTTSDIIEANMVNSDEEWDDIRK